MGLLDIIPGTYNQLDQSHMLLLWFILDESRTCKFVLKCFKEPQAL